MSKANTTKSAASTKERKSNAPPPREDLFGNVEEKMPILRDRYSWQPFNVLDTRAGDWNRSRKQWREHLLIGDVGIKGEEIEQTNAFDKYSAGKGIAKTKIAEEAVFDPMLLEVLSDWYCPIGGRILDYFNGSHVSAGVFGTLGYDFTGIDVRQKIIDQNVAKLARIDANLKYRYLCGDSNNVLDDLVFEEFDFINSCPPYVDLVRYSADNPIKGDISLLNYDEFIPPYRSIIKKSCDLLKKNCYAAITIGQVRDKKTGELLPFYEDTIAAHKDAGMIFYNFVPLIGAFGSAAMRAKGTFERGDGKLVNVHQVVLIFKKI